MKGFDLEEAIENCKAIVVVGLLLLGAYLIWNCAGCRMFSNQPNLIVKNLVTILTPKTTQKLSEELGVEVPSTVQLLGSDILPVRFDETREFQEYNDVFILPEQDALRFIRSLPCGVGTKIAKKIEWKIKYGQEVDCSARWAMIDGLPAVNLYQAKGEANRASIWLEIGNKVTANKREIRFESHRTDFSHPVTIGKAEKSKR